jgi:predicted cation transporter
MHRLTAFVAAMMWSLSALAQATNTPTRPDETGGGMLFGLGILVAAIVVGAVVYMYIKRSRSAR